MQIRVVVTIIICCLRLTGQNSPGLDVLELQIYPKVDGQYRYYISMQQRADKGRHTPGNSADYTGASATLYFEDLFDLRQATSGSYFGFIDHGREFRELGRADLLPDSICLGYYFYDTIKAAVLPTLNLNPGWVLSAKSKLV